MKDMIGTTGVQHHRTDADRQWSSSLADAVQRPGLYQQRVAGRNTFNTWLSPMDPRYAPDIHDSGLHKLYIKLCSLSLVASLSLALLLRLYMYILKFLQYVNI